MDVVPSPSRKRRAIWWTAVAALIASLATFAAYRRWVGMVVSVVVAERSPLTQTIVTSGRVRPPARATLASLVAGRVVELGAREGTHVDAEKMLFSLDDTEAKATLAQAEAMLEEATAQNKEVRVYSSKDAAEAVVRARARLAEAERTHERIQTLYEAGVTGRETLEEAGTSLSLAKSELRGAQLLQSGVKGTKLVRAEAVRNQAQAAKAAAEVRLGYHRVTAPFEGVITQRFIEVGDIVAAGEAAFEMIRKGSTELEIEPDERSLALLKEGQSARASAEAFPDKQFAARVSYIAPAVDPRRGTIQVRLAVDKAPPYLRSDMTVSVEIIVAEKEDVITLPIDAVRALASEEPWVLVLENHTAVRRNVVTGAIGATNTKSPRASRRERRSSLLPKTLRLVTVRGPSRRPASVCRLVFGGTNPSRRSAADFAHCRGRWYWRRSHCISHVIDIWPSGEPDRQDSGNPGPYRHRTSP